MNIQAVCKERGGYGEKEKSDELPISFLKKKTELDQCF
jgi:hypothetical protein